MANYLVLGGSGFIGKSLIRYLSSKGHHIKNIDIVENPIDDLRYIEVAEFSKFDGCFFLAWDVGGSKYLKLKQEWSSQFENNIKLIGNVFPQISKHGIPTLFVSSQLAGVDDSPYSLSKLIAEKWGLTLKNVVIARQWNAYGTMERINIKSHVISDLIIQALETKSIKLLTNGLECRQFTHMDDICEAYDTLINSHIGSIYDVTTGQDITIREIASKICHLTGADLILGEEIGIQPKTGIINKVPHWQPKITIDEGIKIMIKNYIADKKTN